MKDRFISPDHAFRYQKNHLCIDGIPLSELMDRYGSPLYVYSGSAIRESLFRFKKAMKEMPIQVCYAVKANSNLHLLQFFRKLGVGCDLVSFGEWQRAEMAGIPRNLRVLSGVAKTASELDELMKYEQAGVGSIHVESVMEFELIQVLAHHHRRPVRVALRYNPDVDAQTHEKISTGRKRDKFGLTREEILGLCVNEGQDEFVRISGISIHIGSQIQKISPFKKAFKTLSELCDDAESHLGRELDYVDLGGGIGVPYQPHDESISLADYASWVRHYFYSKKRKMKKILFEPGRSLIANAGAPVTEVVYSKIRNQHRTLILDSGMNDLVRPALYDAYHEMIPLERLNLPLKKWDVVGGICETSDYFAKSRPLKLEGLPGERLAILSAGAYGFSMSSTYNTRPQLAEVFIDQGKIQLIRRRQNFQDLIRQEL